MQDDTFDFRLNRRNFLKGLAAMAGIAILPLPQITQIVPMVAPATISTSTPITPELLSDDRIWLDFDGMRHALDKVNISVKNKIVEIGQHEYLPVKRMVSNQHVYLDCWLSDKKRQLEYLNITNSIISPIALYGKYSGTTMKVEGNVKISNSSINSNFVGMTMIMGGEAEAEFMPLRLMFVKNPNNRDFLTIKVID